MELYRAMAIASPSGAAAAVAAAVYGCCRHPTYLLSYLLYFVAWLSQSVSASSIAIVIVIVCVECE